MMPSIAPSPGSFPNFAGSPAVGSHNSPGAPHIAHAPSPGSFMSPAPQPHHSVQSPAGLYGKILKIPHQIVKNILFFKTFQFKVQWL